MRWHGGVGPKPIWAAVGDYACLGSATYSSTLRNCMGFPWRDFLTLLRPSRRLMGIRDEPGILDGLLTGSQRLCGLMCGLVAGLVHTELN